tara:strand:- start:214 stop:1539 length:1326 start_codon:yes stop_codon:yes gene_type:complete
MVLKNPDNFPKFFLVSIIIGALPKIDGYPVVDEFWVLMLLTGLLMRKISTTNTTTNLEKRMAFSLHDKAFILLTFYLLFQSIRGGLSLEDIRMLRWIMFFIIIGIVFFVFKNLKKNIDPNNLTKFVINLSAIYFLLYFISGYTYELLTSESKFNLQHLYHSGTTVANFITVIFIIALIIFSQRYKSRSTKFIYTNLIIFLSFIIVTFTVVYYDSRSGIFVILGALGLNFLFQLLSKNKSGKFQFFLIVIFIVGYQYWAVNYSESNRRVQDFLPIDSKLNLAVPKSLVTQGKGGGRTRMLAPKAAFDFILEDPFHALFGYGWYTSRYELIEPINEMRKLENIKRLDMTSRRDKSADETYQAASATAIMVDTGFLGIFLYLLNLVLGFSTILKSQDNSKYVVSIVYLSIVLWSFVGTLVALMLFHFWVMPKNPVILMLEQKKD